MGDLVWCVNPLNDSMDKMIEKIQDDTKNIFSTLQINYSLEIDPQLKNLNFSPLERKCIYLIYKEAINNIAKHAAPSFVRIAFEIAQQQMILRISDNGKGFDLQNNKGGNGIRTMTKRAEEIGTKIATQSSDKGTAIVLVIGIT